MSNVIINYFTGNNGFFLPDCYPLSQVKDTKNTFFIESNPKATIKAFSFINKQDSSININDSKLFYYNLEDPVIIYRLIDLDPEKITIFLASNYLLFSNIKNSNLIKDSQIINCINIADNIHRLINILKDTQFKLYLPPEILLTKLASIDFYQNILGLFYAEKFHLFHGKSYNNLDILYFDPCAKTFDQTESFGFGSNNLNYISFDS